MSENRIRVEVADAAVWARVVGPANANLRVLAEACQVAVGARGQAVLLDGERGAATRAQAALDAMITLAASGRELAAADVRAAVRAVGDAQVESPASLLGSTIVTAPGGRRIGPRGQNQRVYVDAVRTHDISFGVGPAGTGKTYLAMACAVAALKANKVSRVILTRPAVEAGERLGFLPGDLEAKVNPYLRPLYDALFDLLGVKETEGLMEERIIEVAPLAFMRGRTLSNAFVILDEAQNTTVEQMKMFLTRLGNGSQMVITGDVTQTDLPMRSRSGLLHALRILDGVSGVAISRLTKADVVRHALVQRVIEAYEDDENARMSADERSAPRYG